MAENWKNCLEEELICPICLNVFSEPVQLPCKHNFCRMCINEAWSKDTGMVRCPECNHAYSQKPALEKNHKLSNIVEKFNALNVEKTPAVLHCILCRRGPPLQAQKVCLRCNAPCCHSHVQTHLQQPSSNAGHLLVDAEDVRAWSCPQHDEYRLYHCETEHVAVCQYCCFSRCATNHGHAVCDIEVRRNDIRVSGLNFLCYVLHSFVLPPAKGRGSLLDVAETMTRFIDVVANYSVPFPPFVSSIWMINNWVELQTIPKLPFGLIFPAQVHPCVAFWGGGGLRLENLMMSLIFCGTDEGKGHIWI